MAKWRQQRPRPLDQRGLSISATSFVVPIIADKEFSSEKMVFFVYNHADTIRKRDPLSPFPAELTKSGKNGKGAAFGFPGGGVNPEHLENSEYAALREGRNESGLKITRVRLINMSSVKKNKILILDKRTGDLTRPPVFYEDGRQESVGLRFNEKAILNPMNFYLADVDWLNSKPRGFLLNLKRMLIEDGICTAEDIAKFGLSTNTLTREELLALDVDEEEMKEEMVEIGGFALLPVSFIRWMWKNKWFFLDPEEDPSHRKNNPAALTSYVYYSHIERLIQILDITGVA